MNTKEKILDAALDLFSVHGYEDTSVANIAEAVGIKAPSLYKHYSSKKAIFQAILEKIQQQYQHQASMLQIDGNLPALDAARYGRISEDALVQTVLQLFHFFLQDSYVARCRKMMVLEQYRNAEAAELYRKQYFLDPIAYQTELFRQLIGSGFLKNADPQTMALQFYGPIFTLLQLCDTDPLRIQEAEQMLKNHVIAFHREHK